MRYEAQVFKKYFIASNIQYHQQVIKRKSFLKSRLHPKLESFNNVLPTTL